MYIYLYCIRHCLCVVVYVYIYNVCVCHIPLELQMARASIYCNAIVKWIWCTRLLEVMNEHSHHCVGILYQHTTKCEENNIKWTLLRRFWIDIRNNLIVTKKKLIVIMKKLTTRQQKLATSLNNLKNYLLDIDLYYKYFYYYNNYYYIFYIIILFIYIFSFFSPSLINLYILIIYNACSASQFLHTLKRPVTMWYLCVVWTWKFFQNCVCSLYFVECY